MLVYLESWREGKQVKNPLKVKLVVGAGEVWGSYSMVFSYVERVETEMGSAQADLHVFPTRHQTDLTNIKAHFSQVCWKYFSVTVR